MIINRSYPFANGVRLFRDVYTFEQAGPFGRIGERQIGTQSKEEQDEVGKRPPYNGTDSLQSSNHKSEEQRLPTRIGDRTIPKALRRIR
jgi:hypothetical protein